MKNALTNSCNGYLAFAMITISLCSSASGELVDVPAVADVEIGERPGEDRGSNGDAINTRWNNDNRNELIALRFDLTGVELAEAETASLSLYSFRDEGSVRPYKLYGVVDGAMGGDNNGIVAGYTDDTWDETAVRMSTMPGVIFDGDVLTQGIDAATTVDLGGGDLPSRSEGEAISLTPDGLLAFLQGSPDNLVTLILARDISNTSGGQERFASKEATMLQTSVSGNAGDFAPFLQVGIPDVVGDTDGNGVVDINDLTPILQNYRTAQPERINGDLIDDDFVDFADFRDWKTGYLDAGGSLEGINLDFLTSSVPEPNSLALIGAAVLGLTAMLKRHRAR